ncbi:hypothetical protein [Metabacillus litoralis]|uniref:hypothetical protein n=1 Tax=Metabacillus litoralis TaxID=152268 RepID=UPI00203DD7ED|nr:hypothetical protein [Metabacillus litoralis]MCM3163414.1 hypothetical protein [Metabacillus litoralis]
MKETNGGTRFRENKSQKIFNQPIREWNTGIKVFFLIIIGWLLFKFKMLMFITIYELFFFIIEGLIKLGIVDQFVVYNLLPYQLNYVQDNALINLIINYGVVFSIIGFIDKFFPELYKIIFENIEKLRYLIPTFPFSGLIRFIFLILELVIKVTWIFSSSVIRFITSSFNLGFVFLYKISVPIFSSLFKSLDSFNDKLGSASNRMDSTSRKMEK